MSKLDMDKPCLCFMYGYPAAGKTTVANKFYQECLKAGLDIELISADEVREELYGSQDSFGEPVMVYRYISSKMRRALLANKTVIYDATNLRKDYRMDYLNDLQDIDCYKYIFRVNTPKEYCIENHKCRDRNIPLEKLMPHFNIDEPPTMDEGWDEIVDYSYLDISKSIYIASPFFKEENRENAMKVAEILRKKGHTVYLPLEHKILNAWDYPNYKWGKMVFNNDIDAIYESDCVVVLSYGRESTAGTNWEAGFAWGIGLPVIVVEMPGVKLMSLMLANGRTATLKGIEELEHYDFQTMPLVEDREMEQK
ncbi:MAG: nucleoside 2-deoxyribosyltransferase [Lachnospiraceae bacterium]